MRFKLKLSLLVAGSLTTALIGVQPAGAQSLSLDFSQGQQQPSRQQIEGFCANWGQLSGSQRKQYRAQYERYCRDEPVFGRPAEPQQPAQQQPSQQQQPPQQQPRQQPQKPAAPEEPEQPEPAEPEPQIQPAKPEPVIPEPEPLRVDLVGELALAGPLARQPGERQRLRVTVANRGAGGGPHVPAVNRLWARVFLSDRDVSRRGASAGAFAFSGTRQGHPVRLPGVPGPDQSREVTTEVTLPAGTPDGNYWWCVRLDTRQQVEETDEGNNTACARKVVALGEDSDSELSGVFGSKVATLGERQRKGTRGASQPTHPGLLRQSELDRLAAMLMKTGGTDYALLTGEAGSDLSGAQKRGLLLMRDPGDLIPLGGDYYADGRGNMVLLGELPGFTGDGAPYALTLFSGGGLDLVVDTDRDGVVDLGVSEGLKDRFGFLARPGMEHILDCMRRMVQGGTGAAESLPECLSGGSSDDGGSGNGSSGGGVGDGPGSQLESALQPQCGEEKVGVHPGGVASCTSACWKKRAENQNEMAKRWAENGERELAWAHGNVGYWAEQTHEAIENGASPEEIIENTEEYIRAWSELEQAYLDETTETETEDPGSSASGGASGGSAGSNAGASQPAGDPTMPSDPGTNDPRCEEPSTWNRLHSERCASNTMDCLKRMSDPIYAATGGQCETVRGPDDAERVKCKGNDSFAECLEGSDDVRSCTEKHAGGDDGGGVTPSLNDDMTPDDRGSLGYGLMDVHPFGATLAAMCRSGGGIGPCGDPSPEMDAAR